MNYKAILIIVFVILVSLLALSNALHVYEEGNITLEEHHDHDHASENHSEAEHNSTHEEGAHENNSHENNSHAEEHHDHK